MLHGLGMSQDDKGMRGGLAPHPRDGQDTEEIGFTGEPICVKTLSSH